MTSGRIFSKQKTDVSPDLEPPRGADKSKGEMMTPAHKVLVQLLARQAVRTHLREEAIARRRAHGFACTERS